jgi:hypothetical protein
MDIRTGCLENTTYVSSVSHVHLLTGTMEREKSNTVKKGGIRSSPILDRLMAD